MDFDETNSHLELQYIQKQKNSKRVGYKISKFCLDYNKMTLKSLFNHFESVATGHFCKLELAERLSFSPNSKKLP